MRYKRTHKLKYQIKLRLLKIIIIYIYIYINTLTHVGQSKKNIYTDTRIENFHDEDRGISITGFFKYGNQYKELHEDTVISFPFYEITFDILL